VNHAAPASVVATPKHLWVVGTLAVLWNSLGALDYLMTQTHNEAYMAQFTPEQLAYFYGFPAWVVSAWASAVWGGLLGSILLLLRNRWAAPVFGLSLASMVITTIYNFGFTDGVAIMGTGAAVFSAVIFAIAVALFLYARRLVGSGVLR
jgi:hypothetical protein